MNIGRGRAVNKKRWWALGIFVLLLVVWSVSSKETPINKSKASSSLLGYINVDENSRALATQVFRQGKGKTLAMIKLEGTIMDDSSTDSYINKTYNHQVFLKQLKDVFARDDIKGIVLQVNSPGGGVYESDEIYTHIMDLKARYPKPLVVYMGQTAASGGYYISMAADKIYANRNTLTGSIGVIISTYNYKQLADNIGIQDITFKSGEQKDLLNPMRPVSEEDAAIMQSIVNESYGYFVDVVTKGRHMDRSKVLELADGRIYSGPQAKTLGLVDEVGYLDQAIEATANLANTSDPQILLYEYSGSDLLTWLNSVKAPSFDLLGLTQQIDRDFSTKVMYLAK